MLIHDDDNAQLINTVPDCLKTGEGLQLPPLLVKDMHWGCAFKSLLSLYVLVSVPPQTSR